MSKQPASPPPAYFLSLSLENVRSFGEKQTILFAREDGRPAQWTIILGDNGVGKTTVLKALAAMVMEPHPLADERQREDKSLWTAALYRLSNPLRPIWSPFREREKPASNLYVTSVQGEKLATDAREGKSQENTYNVFKTEEVMASSGVPPEQLICYGYGAGRSVGNSTLSDTPNNLDTCYSLFNDKADLLNPEEWFLQIDYISKVADDNERFIRQRKQVESALLDVLPEIDDLRINYVGTPQQPQMALEFKTPYGWVRLRDMSLGYQTLVVWLTDFASKLFIRYPDSPNPLEEPAIVLIDEIDLHLHPSWQRKLIGFLSGIFKNTQFIATAHSPLVVQAAGDQPSGANVVLLKRVGDHTIVYQGEDLPDVRSWRLDQILSSELFDEVPAHSPDTEKKLQRRDALLAKARLTAKEKEELAELNEWDNTQPVGDSQPERKAADVLRELARKLGKQELLD